MGGAARRAALHRGVVAADRRRGRLHPRGLRVDDRVRERGDGGARARGGGRRRASISVDDDYDALVAEQPATPLDDEREGGDFLYSSGTTGRPKAISAPLPLHPIGTPPAIVPLFEKLYGFGGDTVYLSPAPLYHSAPLRFNMVVHRLGGTTVVMDRFDPAWTLELIERYRVTHTQMVPTMFVRLLRLPRADERDLSSLRAVVHAAAPCPPDVKAAMIEWFGPIVYEYYSATEVYLLTAIDSEDWLAHRGSVGKALLGTPHILDDDGRELPVGEPGTVWSEGGAAFEYHNDPEKTAGSRNDRGWTTVGDIGYLDADGLPLPDRPQGGHDHLRRRQRVSAGGRERPDRASGGRRRRGLRHPAIRSWARRSRASCSCAPATARRPSSRPS